MIAAIVLAAQLNGVDPDLLFSICHIESSGRADAYVEQDGNSPSYGICQLKYKTAKFVGFGGNPTELMNEDVNAYYSAKYLRYLLKRYKGKVTFAVSAYNAGHATSGNTEYVERVMNLYWSLE